MCDDFLAVLYTFTNILLGLVTIFASLARGATYQSIQDEGNACRQMANAMPGLRNLTRKCIFAIMTWKCTHNKHEKLEIIFIQRDHDKMFANHLSRANVDSFFKIVCHPIL